MVMNLLISEFGCVTLRLRQHGLSKIQSKSTAAGFRTSKQNGMLILTFEFSPRL